MSKTDVTIPPAAGFHPAGQVLHAAFCPPPALRKRRYTGSRLAGIRYEAKVHEYLTQVYGLRYVQSPWLRFFSAGEGHRWCQPDGLIIDTQAGRITIVEVKYQFTSDAWWQIKRLYEPVLRVIFPAELWHFDYCQVVKWYDPNVKFQEPIVLAHEVDMRHKHFKVHIWKP